MQRHPHFVPTTVLAHARLQPEQKWSALDALHELDRRMNREGARAASAATGAQGAVVVLPVAWHDKTAQQFARAGGLAARSAPRNNPDCTGERKPQLQSEHGSFPSGVSILAAKSTLVGLKGGSVL